MDEPPVKTVSEDCREVSCQREVSGPRCCTGVERESRKSERKEINSGSKSTVKWRGIAGLIFLGA
jgi:hypothetical protein